MFSLIITIIAIALVAALALATIYYGGSAFNKSAASANAAKLMNQSQQILGADRLYRVDHEGAMPPSMQALVDGGYLRTIPIAQNNSNFSAVAAGTAWSMVASPSGRAYTFSSGDVDSDSCKAVNQMSFGKDGILNKVFTGFKTQCYGPDSAHLTVLVVADPGALAADGATNPELPNTPTTKDGDAPGTSDWTTPPADTSSGGSGGSTPAVNNAGLPNRVQVTFTQSGLSLNINYAVAAGPVTLPQFFSGWGVVNYQGGGWTQEDGTVIGWATYEGTNPIDGSSLAIFGGANQTLNLRGTYSDMNNILSTYNQTFAEIRMYAATEAGDYGSDSFHATVPLQQTNPTVACLIFAADATSFSMPMRVDPGACQ